MDSIWSNHLVVGRERDKCESLVVWARRELVLTDGPAVRPYLSPS